VDQGNVAEDADLDVVHSKILEGPRLGDVLEELRTVAGDARSLHDEIFSQQLLEASGVAGLVGLDVVEVELFEDRQILGRLLVVANLVFLLCRSAFAAGELLLGRTRGTSVRGCFVPSACGRQPVLRVGLVSIRRAVLLTTSKTRSCLDPFVAYRKPVGHVLPADFNAINNGTVWSTLVR
jgi:hypothetical protein